MVFLIMGRSAGNIDRRKTLKSDAKEKRRIRESEITTIYIIGFKLARKHNLKKGFMS